ncbi:EAL domain-containing protein [Agarivorans sp. B2Z047]|uniref:putative bifunctional diguanylate cyclase/phosphodiesterase n=1 Tax=Agarivorans sp. B2Z047 TaxID=2652721 RepID=UPI00128DB477|nr:EAL domain-containing protein [Agarivorans sp. B2Z047]MPW29439.1 EAL domain-containing protein [Agarivorans sp. B2Z047]UQN45028.1 EAL domain-containing protein [Agarivorans sp. B2Z047]
MISKAKRSNKCIVAESLAALLATLLLGFVLAHLEAFETLYSFSRNHESWELDEIILMVLLSPIFLLWLAVRRWAEAQYEAKIREERESQLAYQATHDPLTGLANRISLEDRLSQAVARCNRNNSRIAVLMIDLDDFKKVNDYLGHDAGDRLLREIAQKIASGIRAEDTIARFGGDELVAVLNCDKGQSACLLSVERIIKACNFTTVIDGLKIETSASIGVTFYPEQDQESLAPEQLIRQADQALYRAKLAGKNRYELFDGESARTIKSLFAQREEFKAALANQELQLYYQAQVNTKTGQVIGAEALLRWLHPNLGIRSPVSFLQAIEDHPLIIELGEWVINQALAQLERWQQQGVYLKVSVNISAFHIQQDNFSERLDYLSKQYPTVKPGCLELEITETGVLDDFAQVAKVMAQCQGLGFSFALDDFGTGYASLSYLQSLPAELIKIDRSFVRDVLDDPKDLRMIKGIISLAKVFSLPVIAEGVESKAQQDKLLSLGCALAQGYFYAKALPEREFLEWLCNRQRGAVSNQTLPPLPCTSAGDLAT